MYSLATFFQYAFLAVLIYIAIRAAITISTNSGPTGQPYPKNADDHIDTDK